MSSKKVISFFIIAVAVLCVSAIISVAIIFGGKKITPTEPLTAYSFNFYETNDESIRERSASKLTLSSSVAFKPNQACEWSDGFITFKDTASDGVDYAISSYSKYVCAVPFTAKNRVPWSTFRESKEMSRMSKSLSPTISKRLQLTNISLIFISFRVLGE